MLVAALVTALIAQANPAPPVVTTSGADSITPTTATVAGSVDPNGADTTYQVQYGTSASYGLTSPATDAGAGTSAVAVRIALGSLTGSTTYHYRLVATNAAGTASGADRTFKTAASPPAVRKPTVGSIAATSILPASATLRASVTPNHGDTSVQFQYGTTTAYGATTPARTIDAGSGRTNLDGPVSGLTPSTRYHFRAVATNAAGTTVGGDRTFTTPHGVTAVTIGPSTTRPVWGAPLSVAGKVSGAVRAPVALERQDFPFGAGFARVATTTTSSAGNYTFTVAGLSATTRLRVVATAPNVVASPVATVSVAVKVGMTAKRLAGHRVQLAGSTWPAIPKGTLSLQRQSTSTPSRWILVRHLRPAPISRGRSHYTATVAQHSRALAYRVVAVARNGGANVPGTSRSVTVAKR